LYKIIVIVLIFGGAVPTQVLENLNCGVPKMVLIQVIWWSRGKNFYLWSIYTSTNKNKNRKNNFI